MLLKFCFCIALLTANYSRADILLDLNQQIPFLPPLDTTAGLRLKNVSIPFKINMVYLGDQFLIGAGYENSSSEPLQGLVPRLVEIQKSSGYLFYATSSIL